MRVYFLAERPCALRLGGVYLGLIDGFERSAELSACGLLLEIEPLGGYLPLRFRFDEDFLLSPPEGISLYYTEEGLAVYAGGFLPADQTLKELKQTRLGNSLLTFAVQGKTVLTIENEAGTHRFELPERFAPYEAELAPEGYLLRGRGGFFLLSREGKTLLSAEGDVLENGSRLRAEVRFHDSADHTAVCEYAGGELVSCAIRSAHSPTEATFALALFESALIGADCTPYLHEELREKAGSLKAFLGEFTSVVLTGERDKIGITVPLRERVFLVRYFRISMKDGKVANILPCEEKKA